MPRKENIAEQPAEQAQEVRYPWDGLFNGRPYSNYDKEDQFGPNVVKYDKKEVTTREAFFDKMVENGLDRKEDARFITAMYITMGNYLKSKDADLNVFKTIMEHPAKTPEERLALCQMVSSLKLDREEYYSYRQLEMNSRLEWMQGKLQFQVDMRANGWTKEGDDKLIDAFFQCADYYIDKVTVKSFRTELLRWGKGYDAYGRRAAIQLVHSEDLKNKPEVREILKAEEKRVEQEIKEIEHRAMLAANPTLRATFKKIIELGLDELEPLETMRSDSSHWMAEAYFSDVKPGPELLARLKEDIDKLPITPELIQKGPKEIKKSLDASFRALVEKDFQGVLKDTGKIMYIDSQVYNLDGLKSPEEIKNRIYETLEKEAARSMRMEAVLEDREKNPGKYLIPDRLQAVAKSMHVLIKGLKNDNKEFYEKAKKNGGVADDVPVSLNLDMRLPMQLESFSKGEVADLNSMLDKLARIKQEKKLSKIGDLLTTENASDRFWATYSEEQISDAQIGQLQKAMNQLTQKGLNWDEYMDSGAYGKFLDKSRISEGGRFDPFRMGNKACGGQKGIQTLKDTCSPAQCELAIECLNEISKEYDKKKERISDLDAESLSQWFSKNGYNMLENSVAVANGFEEKEIKGKKIKVIKLGETINEDMIDRDKLDLASYQKLVNLAKEAQALYDQNQALFQEAFDVMHTSKTGSGAALINVMQDFKKMNNDPAAREKLNRFRHLLYEMKASDRDVCKLIDMKNNEKTMLVKPLAADTKFDQKMVEKEVNYIENCVEMLREPSTRVSANSTEYMNIMGALDKLKTGLQKEYANDEEARNAYVKNVTKVLKNINLYRVHKAKDGIKADATEDKLVAAERVEKFLSTRYRTLEKEEYEDIISSVPDLFKVEVEDKNLMGDKYVLAKSKGKIENMRKNMAKIKEEIDKEKDGKQRRNTIGGTKKTGEKNIQPKAIKK